MIRLKPGMIVSWPWSRKAINFLRWGSSQQPQRATRRRCTLHPATRTFTTTSFPRRCARMVSTERLGRVPLPPPGAQTAELDETTLGLLYANASTNSGFLADQRLAESEVWRARGEAWGYSGELGSGSGRGGLRLTDKNHVVQLGARYQVSHKPPGAPSPVTAEISYQGEAPPLDCARAFMVPFTRDGRDVYLVIAFEVQ